jgi:hypothetical protein
VGDRNKPTDLNSEFTQENIAAETSKLKTRRANRKAKPLASVENNKISSARKRRHTEPEDDDYEPAPATRPTTNGESKPKPKRRRHTEPVTVATKGTPASKATKRITAKKRMVNGTNTAPTTPATSEKTEKPKIQRLRLTLKPASDSPSSMPTLKGKKRGADATAADRAQVLDTSPKRQRVTFKTNQSMPKANSHTPAKTKKPDAGADNKPAEKQGKPKAAAPKANAKDPTPKSEGKRGPKGRLPQGKSPSARRGGRPVE